MRFLLVFALAAALWVGVCARPAAAADGPVLSAATFAANGEHEAILSVPVFGRYAITVKSAQGTALQLVDRMAGPGDVQGVPGGADGRIDAFLERGDYKIRLISDAHGSGTAVLAVSGFAELQPQAVQLVEDKPVVTGLGDDQQRSWWIVVPVRGRYEFEAGGRYLNELRLWRDGAWMVDASPIVAQSNADPGRPLALRQLSAQLEPGVYRLTAYGGAPVPWAKGGVDAPLVLRWGVPSLGDSGRTAHTASLLGIDRFLVPASAISVRLVIEAPAAASISAQAFDPGSMFDQSQAQSASIDKTSRDPAAALDLPGGAMVPWLVTVNRQPGQKYRLEVMNQAGGTATVGPGNGSELVAVTLPGNPDDEIDPGFLLVDRGRVIGSSVIELGAALPWRRRFNLTRDVQTFLHTERDVDLVVAGTGAKAAFTVARFLADAPLAQPEPKSSGGVWTLTPGYYLLTASPLPDGRGILTMSIYARGGALPRRDSVRLAAPVFADVQLNPVYSYTLYGAFEGGQSFGIRQESLPSGLAAPVTMELAAGEKVNLPVSFDDATLVSVTDAGGGAVGFAADGGAAKGPETLTAGEHALVLTGPAAGNQVVEVSGIPVRMLPATALPFVPAGETDAAVLPAVTPGVPVYLDLARQQSVSFALPVAKDALYRFETTGLLETGGEVRTRVNPDLAQVEGNGIGRNFLLQTFLRQGDYQLTVAAQGQTTGHAGVSVSETPLVDAGVLAAGRAARVTMAPGQAILYRFHIDAAGTYHLFTTGLGHSFQMRLEDQDGWPLVTPGGAADVTMDFAPGDYRMILLPGTVANRAVTMLQAVVPPMTWSGHGPLAVAFHQDMANRWMEPAAGKPRVPDVWRFSLPAAADVTVTIDHGIRAVVFSADGRQVALTGTSWSGRLGVGDYTIQTEAAAPDNRVDYTLRVDVAQLFAGQSLAVTAPAKIPVSLGGGQVEISSFGGADVRALLFDAGGRLVAANDDRDNDWNFLIAGSFPAGDYSLQVDPVGAASADTVVSVAAPAVVAEAGLAFGKDRIFADGLVHVMPVPAAGDGALLVVGAVSAAPVAMALEAQGADGGWTGVASAAGKNPFLAVPAGGPGLRLRVWAEDHGPSTVTVTAVQAAPAAMGVGPVALQGVAVGVREVGVAKIAVAQLEILRFAGAAESLRWSGAAGVPVRHDPAGTVAVTAKAAWVVDDAAHAVDVAVADPSQAAQRVTLAAGETLALPVGDGMGLWEVSAQGAQPGVFVGAEGGAPVMALAPGGGLVAGAVAFQPAGMFAPILRVWQAGGAAAALPVTVRKIGFGAPGTFTVGAGEADGVVGAGAALQAGLPGGWQLVSLDMPAGLMAVFLADGRPVQVVAANGAAPDVLESDADEVLVLNPGAVSAAFGVSLQGLDRPGFVLKPGGLLTRYGAAAAVWHVAVPSGTAAALRIAGAARDVAVVGADGAVTRGADAVASAGSVALVDVGPGAAVVSMDGDAGLAGAEAVSVPGSVGLAGAAEAVRVAPAGARLVHVETDAPVVLRAAGGPAKVYPAGAAADLFQPAGSGLGIGFYALGAGGLGGAARFSAVDAVPISEGLGATVRVGPGEARLFSFSVASAREIGVGVRGSVDDAQCRLLAADGTVLGQGVVTMSRVAAGTYYLAVDVPADGVATEMRPALVGVTLPDDGPPADVKAEYEGLGDGS